MTKGSQAPDMQGKLPPSALSAEHAAVSAGCSNGCGAGKVSSNGNGLHDGAFFPKSGSAVNVEEALWTLCERQGHLEERIETWNSAIMANFQHLLANGVKLNGVPRAPSENAERASSSSSRTTVRDPLIREALTSSKFNAGSKSTASLHVTTKQETVSGRISQNVSELFHRNIKKFKLKFLGEDASESATSSSRESLRAHIQQMQQKDTVKNILDKKTRKTVADSESASCAARVVGHHWFDHCCAAMVLFNSIIIGVSTEYEASHPTTSPWMEAMGHACTAFFVVELLLRLRVHGWDFLADSEDRQWNLFDTALVVTSIVDVLLSSFDSEMGNQDIGKALKTIKMLRIMRLLRMFRFFKELALLALMIADSLVALFWAMVMLGIIMFVFAICFTQSATAYRIEHDISLSDESSMVNVQFGSLARSFYYLILSMLGGISWGEVCNTLMDMGTYAPALFFFYIAFTMLAVLNIITGVFVDNALEIGKSQRDWLVAKEQKSKEKCLRELGRLFADMDTDESGLLSWDEISAAMESDKTRMYFAALGMDPEEVLRLFNLIDASDSGEECRRLQAKVDTLVAPRCPNFQDLPACAKVPLAEPCVKSAPPDDPCVKFTEPFPLASCAGDRGVVSANGSANLAMDALRAATKSSEFARQEEKRSKGSTTSREDSVANEVREGEILILLTGSRNEYTF